MKRGKRNGGAPPPPVEERDRCLLCGRELSFSVCTPISKRRWYIEGGGQLCGDCYYDVYRQTAPMTEEEMERLLNMSRLPEEE